MVRAALAGPLAVGTNCTMIFSVLPWLSVKSPAAPTMLNGPWPRLLASMLPCSTPRPRFFIVSVCFLVLPIATLPKAKDFGALNEPACAVPVTGKLTKGAFGSLLEIATAPIKSAGEVGVKLTTISVFSL